MELWSLKKTIVALSVLVNNCYAADANEQLQQPTVIARLIAAEKVKKELQRSLIAVMAEVEILKEQRIKECEELTFKMVQSLSEDQIRDGVVPEEIRANFRGVGRKEVLEHEGYYISREDEFVEQALQKKRATLANPISDHNNPNSEKVILIIRKHS